jgi:N-hydroxyarylamine O-acetyltransferase
MVDSTSAEWPLAATARCAQHCRVDIDAYLKRIGYSGPTEPTIETLRGMQRAHFYTVPFENLDIRAGRRIEVDEGVNYAKLVGAGRGGFCLELNGMFARTLRGLGFEVDVLAGRVFGPNGRLGEPFTHMTLLVHLDEPWIADVGFGGRIGVPLRLNDSAVQEIEGRTYIVDRDGDQGFVTAGEPGNPPMTYTMSLQPRRFAEFEGACEWLQTSPDSRFTHGPMISIATPTGRKTLAGTQYILTINGERTEREIAEAEIANLLANEFGIRV